MAGTSLGTHEQQLLGFNYRMTDMQAALGLSRLAKLDTFLTRRRAIARRYDEAFRHLAHVMLPQSTPEQRARSGHHLYVACFDFAAIGTTRTRFMTVLREASVGSQVHYIPVYRQPYYAHVTTARPDDSRRPSNTIKLSVAAILPGADRRAGRACHCCSTRLVTAQ